MSWSLWFNRISNGAAEELAGWSWVEWWAVSVSALVVLCIVGRLLAQAAANLQRGGSRHV